MAVLVAASQGFPVSASVNALRRYGVEANDTELKARSFSCDVLEGVDCIVLVFEQGGVVPIAETLEQVRLAINRPVPVFVCLPSLPQSDRAILKRSGAAALMTPHQWSANAVAERIVAEFILSGDVEPSRLDELRGGTIAMREVYTHLERFAPLEDTVLICGETGTGKELAARALHTHSGRTGELVSINCAELSSELLESELFGHERGAFTGAVSARRGLLLAAGAATVFLDEIGELSAGLQAKLLRAVEERQVRPLGSNRKEKIQARLIFATNKDLDDAVKEGQFRRDLYERIRTLNVLMPPLRERRADIPLLATLFVEEFNIQYPGRRLLPDGASDNLFKHSWPGNVRELRNVIRKAAVFAEGLDGPISAITIKEVLSRPQRPDRPFTVDFNPVDDNWRAVHDRARRAYFLALLAECSDDKAEAAKRAGMSRSQFYDVLKQLNRFES